MTFPTYERLVEVAAEAIGSHPAMWNATANDLAEAALQAVLRELPVAKGSDDARTFYFAIEAMRKEKP